ncbi:MAG: diguanylate cyclase [Gammaproteobacteria bacterium]|nr:diguanylate cyclase [Gammaproteobacteria bacterium]MCW8927936.1 diguanylate cyclase [Gammaproteobacteria bacterium]MCW8972520.1 diguanylate cyclase [Gammaproteobacteria bacterium]MCW8993132.1 diguanylate cyclase [Gammaproteobacteria bacterium]
MAQSRIMVVDGSAVSREIVIRILTEVIEGAEITACAGGLEALEQLDQQQYDLITTALMLSDIDGLDLCRRVRASSRHRFTPVIVISGDANERLLKEGFAAGVTDYFDKSHGYPLFGQFIKAFNQRSTGLVGRVLYVEDSLTAATFTLRILERHGLQVTHVSSAEEALAILQRRHDTPEAERDEAEQFDLVLTDFHLQSMTGGDLLHAIRTRYQYSRQTLPVLMITGSDCSRTQVEAFHAGANDFINKPMIEEVLMARIHSLMLIKQQYDVLQRQTQAMEKVATTDSLTGVRNRHYLFEHGESLRNAAENQPFWSMIIDIDHFKQINDDQGHLVGDHILVALGELLNRHFPDATVIRFGGEEFVVLLPHTLRKDAMYRAEGLRQAVEILHPEGVPFTISIGMAGSEDHPQADLNALLRLADEALYASKLAGRNRVHFTPAGAAPVALALGAASSA